MYVSSGLCKKELSPKKVPRENNLTPPRDLVHFIPRIGPPGTIINQRIRKLCEQSNKDPDCVVRANYIFNLCLKSIFIQSRHGLGQFRVFFSSLESMIVVTFSRV